MRPILYRVYIDGGVRQHQDRKQRRGYIAIVFEGEPIVEPLGPVTSNEAEYHALIRALQVALARGAHRVEILADSELLVKQITGQYRVRKPNLRPLYERARDLRSRLAQFEIRKIPRKENRAGHLLEQ